MQSGDLVTVPWPCGPGNIKHRPALVLGVEDRLGQERRVLLAYGTSKHTDKVEPWELLLSPTDGASVWILTGLQKPTVFSLLNRRWFNCSTTKFVGSIHIGLNLKFEVAATEAIKRNSTAIVG